MNVEEILELVAELDATIGPDTHLRWERERGVWYPDDDADASLRRLLQAWRLYSYATAKFKPPADA
jgi:hypothetical protein